MFTFIVLISFHLFNIIFYYLFFYITFFFFLERGHILQNVSFFHAFIFHHSRFIFLLFMVVLSKFSDIGKQYLASMRCHAWYRNIKKDILGWTGNYLFYSSLPKSSLFSKCSSVRCKTCPNVSISRITFDFKLNNFLQGV